MSMRYNYVSGRGIPRQEIAILWGAAGAAGDGGALPTKDFFPGDPQVSARP
jgi:hypothetical protein